MQVYSISFVFHARPCSRRSFLKGCIVRSGPRLRQFVGLHVATGARASRVAESPRVVGSVDGGRFGGVHVLHTEKRRALAVAEVADLVVLPLAVRQAALRAVVPGVRRPLRHMPVEPRPPAPTPPAVALLLLLPRGHVLLRGLVILIVHEAVRAGREGARAVRRVIRPPGPPVAVQEGLVVIGRVGRHCDGRGGGRQGEGVAGVGRGDLKGRHLRGQ